MTNTAVRIAQAYICIFWNLECDLQRWHSSVFFRKLQYAICCYSVLYLRHVNKTHVKWSGSKRARIGDTVIRFQVFFWDLQVLESLYSVLQNFSSVFFSKMKNRRNSSGWKFEEIKMICSAVYFLAFLLFSPKVILRRCLCGIHFELSIVSHLPWPDLAICSVREAIVNFLVFFSLPHFQRPIPCYFHYLETVLKFCWFFIPYICKVFNWISSMLYQYYAEVFRLLLCCAYANLNNNFLHCLVLNVFCVVCIIFLREFRCFGYLFVLTLCT